MRRLPLLLLAGYALIATACVTTEVEIRVNEDGSGTTSILFALDRAAIEAFAAGEEIGDPAEEMDTSALPPGAVVESINTDTQIGVKVSVPFEAGADVGAAIEKTFAAISGEDGEMLTGDGGLFETFTLVREGDRWRFAARTSTPDPEGEGAEMFAMASGFLGDAKLVIRIALPGTVTEQDADRVEADGTLVWELPLLSPAGRDLSATSDLSGGGLNVPLITGIVILAAAAAGLGTVAWRRRAAAQPTAPETPSE